MQPGEELENLVAELEDIVSQAKPTFGGGGQKKIVDSEEIYQVIDDIKDTFPEEFATARRILKEQDEILAHAQQQADSIIADAQQQALTIAGEAEIVRLAQQQADDIRDRAQQYERETRYAAEDYAEQVFTHLEENLKSLTSTVARCRQQLNEGANGQNGSW